MRSFFYITSAIAVMALAFWAYHQNYKTQRVQKETARLNQDIARLREDLAILNAEWAYLNRPERLMDLSVLNFETLGLLPLTAEQFGRVDQVAFPRAELPPITEPVDVAGETEQEARP